jgi:hypothetical protein
LTDDQPGSLSPFLRRIQHAGCLLPASLTGYLWLKGGHPHLLGWSCPLRALTGIPCPTCFLTRATELALRGDLGGSLQMHAFGPLVAAGLVWWSIRAIRQRRLRPRWLNSALSFWVLTGASASLIGYWLLRLGLGSFPSG